MARWDFDEKALLGAEVRLSRAEAELLARSLRSTIRRDLAAAHERGEDGPSAATLRTAEAVASALEGATLSEAAKRSEEAWTGDRERDGRRAAEEERRAEEASRRELEAAGHDPEKILLFDKIFEGMREGRTEYSAEEVDLMRATLGLGKPSSAETIEGFLDRSGKPGENN